MDLKFSIPLLLVAFATVRADTVELKTGEKVEGKFRRATDAGAVIEVGGQPITFALDKVRAIYFGNATSAQQPGAYADAMDALRGLRSLTTGSVALRDYSSRVADARIRVGRYLDSAPNGAQKTSIATSMKFYEFAARLWPLDVIEGSGIFREIARDPDMAKCPSMQREVDLADAQGFAKTGKHSVGELRFTILAFGETGRPQFLWKCASELMADASK
jgi:hypothetical protein